MKCTFLLIFATVAVCAKAHLNDELLDDYSQFDTDDSTHHRMKRSPRDEENYELTAQDITEAAYYIMAARVHFKPPPLKKAIFLLGLPNSGKSNLIKSLTPNSLSKSEIDNVDKPVVTPYAKIFPKITQTESNVYIECPSLTKSTNASIDFAQGYFIKRSFENVKQVKILLTYPFKNFDNEETWLYDNSTDSNNHNGAVLDMLFHTVQLIRYIEKFNKSIAFVVTGFKRNNNEEFNTEFKRKEYIAENFVKIIEYINDTSPYSSDGKKMRKLANILLTKENDDYIYINVPFDTNDSLLKTVNDDLAYVSIVKSDVRYTAFENSKGDDYWYRRYFSSFMEVGTFLKMFFTFFKLID